MRTTKKVVVELDAGEVLEVVARFRRDGLDQSAVAVLEHDVDLEHPQLRIDITKAGQANVLNKGVHLTQVRLKEPDVQLDEVFFNHGISIFL